MYSFFVSPNIALFFRARSISTTYILFIVVIVAVACSSPKKTSAKADLPTVTRSRSDMLVGGTSYNNAVVIMVQDERTGLDEEYKWLSINYPGYSLVRRTHVTRSSKQYDIVRIKTKQGNLKDIYFDSTRFWGKN